MKLGKILECRHYAAAIAVFSLGNLIIGFPRGEGIGSGLLGFGLCLMIAFGFCFLYSHLQSADGFGICSIKGNVSSPFFKISSAILILFICSYAYTRSVSDYVNLVTTVRLPQTPKIVITGIFIVLGALIAKSGRRSIIMFSLVTFVFIFAVSLIMFILSVFGGDVQYLSSGLEPDWSGALKQALTFYIHSFGQIIIPLLILGRSGKRSKKINFSGVAFGGAIFALCILSTFLNLGAVSYSQDFPYSAAMSVLRVGRTAARLDGFTYYFYFICALLKSSMALLAAEKTVTAMSFKSSKAVTAIIIISGLFFALSSRLYELLQADYVNLALLLCEILLPCILLIGLKSRHTVEQSHSK